MSIWILIGYKALSLIQSCVCESKEEGKDQESINTLKYHTLPETLYGKVTKTQGNIQESQEVSPFPAGDHKAARNRHDSKIKTNVKHK